MVDLVPMNYTVVMVMMFYMMILEPINYMGMVVTIVSPVLVMMNSMAALATIP